MVWKNGLRKLMVSLLIAVCCILPASAARAENLADERVDGLETFREIDEEGNISEYAPEEGDIEQLEPVQPGLLRSAPVQIVNLNVAGNKVIEYVHADKSGLTGYTNGAYGADAAYLGSTSDGKIKFMLAGVTGIVDAAEVQLVDWAQAQSVSFYTVSGGRLIHKITTNLSKTSYGSSLDNGPAPSYLKEGSKYYSYDGHYFYSDGQYAVMLEDYKNDVRTHAVNPGEPYYNYYQFLPLRSITSYTAEELNNIISQKAVRPESKMRGIGSDLVKNQKLYGVNALLTAGIAANESGWGTSSICQSNNNLFGLNAIDSDPSGNASKFSSVSQCIKEFMETWMSKQYMNPKNWKYLGAFLGNKDSGFNVRYASDPYWGEKAASIAYTLDKLGGSRDMNRYTIGLKDQRIQVNVREDSTTKSTVFYKTPFSGNVTFIIRDPQPENGFFEIQSDGVVNTARTGLNGNTGYYESSEMYAYISSGYVHIISEGKGWYEDVSEGDWYYDAVKFVSDFGIMTGLDEVNFGAVDPLSRAQFAVIVWRMAGEEYIPYDGRFSDVSADTWYTNAVSWSSAYHIITGYTNTGRFEPAKSISRQEIAVMLYRFAQAADFDTSQRADLGRYQDSKDITSFAYDAMRWAVGAGIIGGKYNETVLDPLGEAARAECAVMIERFIRKYAM